MIYYIKHTTSTNDEVRDPKYGHLDAVWAEHQSAGRGQRGHSWHSHEGENITFSVVLTPTFLPIHEQFLLSEIVALSLVHTLREYGIECRIKWTNDIYAGDNKIVGILIEHALSGDTLARTIAGIGLNVNQLEFPDDLPNPTSMARERGQKFDREDVIKRIVANIEALYNRLERGEKEDIESEYIATMYHLGESHLYAYPDGEQFVATIRGVRHSGELCLEHGDGVVREYAFKEVEFVLPHKGVNSRR
jgi:BirA family biotin operon repressor/biotin-[acetyl-CoA-carboxylase] ligase